MLAGTLVMRLPSGCAEAHRERLLGNEGEAGRQQPSPAQAPWARLLTSALASSRASAWPGKTAAPPNLTSTTSADSLSTTFLLRMEAEREAEGLWVRESWRFLRCRASCLSGQA